MENEQLNRSLELFNDFAENGIDFVMEQSPLLCNEIILLAQISSMATFIAMVLLSAGVFIAVRLAWKNRRKSLLQVKQHEEGDFTVFLTVVPTFLHAIVIIPIATFSAYYFLFATFAPRLYLFEYFTKLL